MVISRRAIPWSGLARAAAVGAGVALGWRAEPGWPRALHLVGYPAALVVIARFVNVVRHRERAWLIVHELAMAGIAAGFVVVGQWSRAVPNALWLLAAALWYGLWPAGEVQRGVPAPREP